MGSCGCCAAGGAWSIAGHGVTCTTPVSAFSCVSAKGEEHRCNTNTKNVDNVSRGPRSWKDHSCYKWSKTLKNTVQSVFKLQSMQHPCSSWVGIRACSSKYLLGTKVGWRREELMILELFSFDKVKVFHPVPYFSIRKMRASPQDLPLLLCSKCHLWVPQQEHWVWPWPVTNPGS